MVIPVPAERRSYWLLDWLDSEGIGTPDVALGVLRTQTGWRRFRDAARRELQRPAVAGVTRNALLAGPTLDLSGSACNGVACLQNELDELIRRSWLYFDSALVHGLDPRSANRESLAEVPEFGWTILGAHLATAFYIRDSGAEEFLNFDRVRRFCEEHLEQHAAEAGLPPMTPAREALVAQLSDGYEVRFSNRRASTAAFIHPALPGGAFLMEATGLTEEQVAAKAVASISNRSIARLIDMVAAARETRATPGQLGALSGLVVPAGRDASAPAPADVAIDLSLPFVEGVPAKDLLALRADDMNEFLVFRGALRKTIEERIKALPASDARGIADSVVDDVLTPAIAGLDRKLRRSSTLLKKRSAAAVVAGGTVTTVGLVMFTPLAVPGLIVGVGGLLANYVDLLKDKREVELSDLHFLWRVSDRAAGLHR